MGVNKNIHIDHLEYMETIFKVLNYKKIVLLELGKNK